MGLWGRKFKFGICVIPRSVATKESHEIAATNIVSLAMKEEEKVVEGYGLGCRAFVEHERRRNGA